MRRILGALAVLALVSGFACAHLPPPIKDFGQCLSQEMSPQVASIITEVESALATGNYWSVLTDLGKRVGFAVVDCAVHEVEGSSRAKMRDAPGDQMARMKVDRAYRWLGRGTS